MTMASFKSRYMELYWQFDNLFLVAARCFGITYHEFVLISLRLVWPTLTLEMTMVIVKQCQNIRH